MISHYQSISPIFKGHWLGHIDWNRLVTWTESRRPLLRLTLNASWFSIGASWSYLGNFWGISSRYFCAVSIDSFNPNRCRLASELLIWSEGNGTVWINGISSLISHYQSISSIFKGHWFGHIDWNCLVAWTKSWLATLRLTLKAGWFSIGASRHYPCYRWRIGSSHFCSVFIYTFNSNWSWGPHILFVWGKGDSTIWVDGIFPYSLNRLLRLTIFKGHWRIHINRNCLVTWGKGRLAALWLSLQACWLSIGASWCDPCYRWRIGRSHFRSIFINTFYCDWCWRTNIPFLRSKSDRTIRVDGIFPNSLNSLLRLTIFEGHWTIRINWNSWVARSESRCTWLW